MREDGSKDTQDLVLCPKCGQCNAEFNPRCKACGWPLPRDSRPAAEDPDDRAGAGTDPAAMNADPLLGQSLSRYRVVERLARGGMGVVYRGEDRESGQAVALKTVALPDVRSMPTLRREIHALARLRHPGIVRILESGTHQGMPWIAMELVEGVDPRRCCAKAGGPADAGGAGRVPIALRLVRRLCEALAYLHGEGIVHRDLKPENILVRSGGPGGRAGPLGASGGPGGRAGPLGASGGPGGRAGPPGAIDGWPVLVDFGLSTELPGAQGREVLAVEAAGAGTLAYMAPEQIRGQSVDARADLYSLGCVLFELLTDRPPFVGATAQAVKEGHLHRVPPKLSELVPGVEPKLEELVLRLLAKSPRERLGHADVLASALEALGAEDGPSGAFVQRQAYLYRSGFVGREGVLLRLEEHLERLGRGLGRLVLVGGESGVGKTRLLLELAREARRRGVSVLAGECLDQSGQPLEALRKPLQAVADLCRAGGPLETERLLGRRGKVLASYEPGLRGLPGQEHHPEPAELPAAAARLRLYADLAKTFSALAGAGAPQAAPVMLVLDDLQWADDLTLEFLQSLTRSGTFERNPLLVLGAYRTEEVDAQQAASLRALAGSAAVERFELGRLGEDAVGSMVGDMLALSSPPELFVRFLSRQSEGNPFFVAEYLRAAVAERLLWRDGQGHWKVTGPGAEVEASEEDYAKLPLPGSVRELVGRRLQGLPEGARSLLDAAAVLGREAEAALAAAMTRMDDVRFDEALAELLRRQVLEAPGPELLRFVHDKIREVAYENLQGETRRALHRAAAEAIETRPAQEQDRPLAALGRHWEQAGEAARARPCYLQAARQASSRYALGEAERLYRAYLRLVPEPSLESISARNELAEGVLGVRGRHDEALGEHEKALSEARRMGARALEGESLRGLGLVHWRTARPEEAREAYEQALDISRQLGDLRFEANVTSNLGTLRMDQGRTAEARQLYEQALAISLQLGDRRFEGGGLSNLGILHMQQGRTAEARQHFEQALAISCQLGDLRFESNVLDNLGILHMQQGRMAEARQHFEQALAISRQRGDLRFESNVLCNLGGLHLEQGRMAEARQHFEQALAISRQLGDRRTEPIALGNLGLLHLEQGQTAEARQLYEQALAISRQLGDRRFEGIMLGGLANVELFGATDRPRAKKLAEEGERLLAAVGDQLELAIVLCCQGHIALAGGRGGREPLARAEVLASAAGAGADSPFGKAVSRLRRAVAAFEAGEHHRLFRGKLIEDLPEGLRRRFIETGELGGEPERRRGKRRPGKERSSRPSGGERRERP